MTKKTSIFSGTAIPLLILLVIWSVHFLNLRFLNLHFLTYGIFPREIEGLKGILFSPFIHSTKDFSHIFNNSVPLVVLTWLLRVSYRKLFFKVLIFIWLVSGAWVWIAARGGSYHIGASGIIYGLAFFLFFSGVFRKNMQLMGVSLIVSFLYGSMIWGIFPSEESISFEAHLFGALAGLVLAFYYKKEYAEPEKYNLKVHPEFEEFVEEYNRELKIQEANDYLNKVNTSTSLDKNYKVFFEYISKEEKKKK